MTERRNEFSHSVEKAVKEIEEANELHDEGEKIEVSLEPHGYIKDWALIELDKSKID